MPKNWTAPVDIKKDQLVVEVLVPTEIYDRAVVALGQCDGATVLNALKQAIIVEEINAERNLKVNEVQNRQQQEWKILEGELADSLQKKREALGLTAVKNVDSVPDNSDG